MNALAALLQRPIPIESVTHELLEQKGVQLDVLRADLIHPQISGNKLFKLLPYFKQLTPQTQAILSFGGAHSNHLRALAYACKLEGVQCLTVIRGGEKPTPTIERLEQSGAQIIRISRVDYQKRHEQEWLNEWQSQFPSALIIPEGGMGEQGVLGCYEWGKTLAQLPYEHIAVAVGTGTTALGLALGSQKKVTAIVASKDVEVPARMEAIKTQSLAKLNADIDWEMDYHFGGFAKKNKELESFIEAFNRNQTCTIEPVYTGKLLYALFDKIAKQPELEGSRCLAIHTGGLGD